MKRAAFIVFAVAAVVFLCTAGWAEEKSVKASSEVTEVTIVSPATEAGEDLDLYAVAELFKETETVEAFEKALNDSANGINNLDLAGDGSVDYIHVVDNTEGNTHILILQVALAKDDYQDVATIEIEKKGEEEVDLQVVGNEEIYGENYVVEPDQSSVTVVHVHTWPVIRFMFGPAYRPWRSPWGWGRYPALWKPWHRVPVATYRARTVRWTRQATFRHTQKRRIKRSHVYKPRSSKQAVRKTRPPATKSKTSAKQRTLQPAKASPQKAPAKPQANPRVKQAPKKQQKKAPPR
jgi:hypothetical protein